ncbi:MAG TPA: glycosyltransferase family 4 protein [bacterium]|nr:glycosyltransferase family 4 protein [bacterium]HOL47066.1 glycosyltransferase family 4 protein [bacterium]HPQ18966.1 glycosyltransferase family 4 protein [bacterium]
MKIIKKSKVKNELREKEQEIKIAVYCPGFGRIPRGIETVVYEIFSRLGKNKNYKITIYTGAKNFSVDFAKIISVPVIPYTSKIARLYSRIAKRLKFVANENYDFDFLIFAFFAFLKSLFIRYDIIFNESGLYMQYFLKIYKFIYRTKIIHSGHAGINKLEFSIARLKPDIYIASSPFAYKEIKKRFSDLDVRVLPNGVSLEQKEKKELDLIKPIILYVGALVAYKQVDKLIKAFSKVNKGSLLIIGDGELYDDLNELAENLKIRNIKFIKGVPLEELQKYFNSSDLFVLPSKNETFGIVYLNALAANIPAIADKSEIQKWILKDAGLTCNCEDENELTETIKKCLEINWADRPLKRAEYFSWNKCAKCYDKIIKEVISGKEKYNWEEYWQ